MINLDEERLVARYDNRPGYSIVDYEVVGIPVWKLSLVTQVLEESQLAVTEKFVLKAINSGLDNVADIASLLGLDESIVISICGHLYSNGALSSSEESLSLTRRGSEVLHQSARWAPREAGLFIFYDPFIVKPIQMDSQDLWQPKEMRGEGIRTLNPSPNRTPFSHELDRADVEDYMRASIKSHAKSNLIRIKRVLSRRTLFQRAIAIVYKADAGRGVQVGFLVNERASNPHEKAFREQNGIDRYGIARSVDAADDPEWSRELEALTTKRRRDKARRDFPETRKLTSLLFSYDGQIERLSGEEDSVTEGGEGGRPSESYEVERLKEKAQGVKSQLYEHKVRMVSVYEHRHYLSDALTESKEEVIIVSPWIRDSVVDDEFLFHLRGALRRGVTFYIGYGIGGQNEPGGGSAAERLLMSEASSWPNLHIKRLGDTHAKVLIVDTTFLIITSFNWLSFKGDPNRTFREEWGTYVAIKESVERQAAFFKERISE